MLASLARRVTPLRDVEDDDLLRQPPANPEAEQAVLGAILISNPAYYRVCDIIGPEHFSNAIHSRIFSAIGRILDTGHEATPVSLKHYFDADGALHQIGGGSFLGLLANAAVTIINAEDYARIILDLAQRRQLLLACDDLSNAAYQPSLDKPALNIIEEFEGRLNQIADGKKDTRRSQSIATVAEEVIADTEKAYKEGAMFIPTGLGALDKIIGGMLPGDLEILASRPGIGKTAMALTICEFAATHGHPTYYFSLEQTAKQLVQRLLSFRTGIPVLDQQLGRLDMVQMHQLIDASEEVKNISLYFDDNAGLTISQICYRARRAWQRQKIGLIVIDHLQLVAPNGKKEARRLEMDEITGSLKILAKELDIPVLALSQLTRGVEQREDKRPTLQDLRESGGIEQDADRVMFLYREEYYVSRTKIERREGEDNEKLAARHAAHNDRLDACRGLADVFIAKNRHGEANRRADLAWDAQRMRFRDLATKGDLASFTGIP